MLRKGLNLGPKKPQLGGPTVHQPNWFTVQYSTNINNCTYSTLYQEMSEIPRSISEISHFENGPSSKMASILPPTHYFGANTFPSTGTSKNFKAPVNHYLNTIRCGNNLLREFGWLGKSARGRKNILMERLKIRLFGPGRAQMWSPNLPPSLFGWPQIQMVDLHFRLCDVVGFTQKWVHAEIMRVQGSFSSLFWVSEVLTY